MFHCTTKLNCDICRQGFETYGTRMSDCISKQRFRNLQRKNGWKTIYGKYDICPDCLKHYGIKLIRNKIKEREQG